MPRPPVRRRAALFSAGIALSLLPGGPAALAQDRAEERAPSATARAAHTVTLVTGDQVTVTELDGGRKTVAVERAEGATGLVRTDITDGRITVVPAEAQPYLDAGLLDHRLFDVTALIEQGHAERAGKKAAQRGLPLIVTYGAKARTTAAPRGTTEVRALSSVDGVAVRAAKNATFWSSVTAGGTKTRAGKPAFAGGVAKVWLDGRVEADMAESNAQIGTPEAWDAGFTGEGVKVAVLDTGADEGHPDLADRITDSRSFIEGEETTDRRGHGTHTASTVGGSGAASDGKEKGVAPGADLAVGKVLSDEGFGSESQIIAGMEWAAKEIDAKIVSMSLGSQEASDGTDPMAQAVNTLSEETGALFVVAAGNTGAPTSIGSPGAADSALTVGAVDSADQAAYFTSAGPRLGDQALKPDLSAPGVEILAARSSLAEGDGDYIRMSGTSMATPHVAGAAALLAQQHPDWGWRELKDALMSTADQLDASAYTLGAGRLSAAGAVGAEITATGSADLGFHGWPYEENEPVTRELTYTNSSDAPVTLDLAATGAADGVATLADTRLTVPAHGTARTTVTGDATGAPAGTTSGRITATADGKPVAHTAFGLVKEEERYTLTVKVKDRDGAPAAASLAVQELAAGAQVVPASVGSSGTLELRLKPGSYALSSYLDVRGGRGKDSLGLGYLAAPEVVLDRDREVVLDGRTLREIGAQTAQRSETRQLIMEAVREAGGSSYSSAVQVPLTYDTIFAAPTKKPATGSFEYRTVWRLGTPMLTAKAGSARIGEATLQSGSTFLDGKLKARLFDAGDGSPEAYGGKNAKGKAVLVRTDGTVKGATLAQRAVDAGAAALLVTDDTPGRLMDYFGGEDGRQRDIPVATVDAADGARLTKAAASGKQLELTGTPYPSHVYDYSEGHPGAIPDKDLTIAPRARDLATVNTTFYAPKPQTGGEFRYSVADAFPVGVGFPERASYPAKRTDHVMVAKDLTWHESVTAGPDRLLEQRSGLVTYPAGKRTELNWFRPVWHPWLGTGLGWGQTRTGNDLAFNTPGWGDSGPDHTGFGDVWNSDAMTQTTEVFVDGVSAVRQKGSGINLWDMDAAEHTYKIVTDTTLDREVLGLGTKGHTAWEVRSARTPNDRYTYLPVINLGFSVETALDGTVKAGRRLPVGIDAEYIAGASDTGTITTGALAVSYDRGKTWTQVDLRKKGTSWTGALSVPRTADSVSLRASVRDDQGGAVTQVLTDALDVR